MTCSGSTGVSGIYLGKRSAQIGQKRRMTMADSKIAYRTVNVDGVDIFYREAGPKDARTVLLFHGFPSSSHMFRGLILLLMDKYHIVAQDFPGSRPSSLPPHARLAF